MSFFVKKPYVNFMKYSTLIFSFNQVIPGRIWEPGSTFWF